MPRSVSRDGGASFEVTFTELDSVKGGQRPVLLKLHEGPLLLCSFSRGMRFPDTDGNEVVGTGLYGALSWDGGYSWPVKRLITLDAGERAEHGGAWTGSFTLTPTSAEPKGYLTATQAEDGTIHLISSRNHYAFNLAWLQERYPNQQS